MLPDENEISIIPLQLQSIATISDEDLDEDSIILDLCKCGADVHEQTTLKLDTPDRTQSPLLQSQNLENEVSLRNESGSLQLATSPLNQNRNIKPESSPRNQSENSRATSQSTLNRDTNLVTERGPRDLSEKQKPASRCPFCLSRYVIPIIRTRQPSDSLQPDSSQSARNQSANLVYERSSRDQSEEKDLSQSRYNIPKGRPKERSESLQPDLNQSTRSGSTKLVSDQCLSDQSDKQKRLSNQSQINLNILEANPRERNKSQQPEASQSARNQSTDRIPEYSSMYQSENEKPALDRSQNKYSIPEARPRKRSVSLQLDSDQSANNQSINTMYEHSSKDDIADQKTAPKQRYLVHKTSPRDLVVRVEKGQSQYSKNKSLNSPSEHANVGSQNENPRKLNESLLNQSLELDQSQPRSKDQSKDNEGTTKQSEIDGNGSIPDSQKYVSSEHLPKATTSKSEIDKEKTSKSENDKEKSAEECQCKCSCQNISNAATTISDSQHYTSLRHLPKAIASKSEKDKEKTISMSENIKEKSADECQCKCTCQYPSYDLTTISDSQNYMSSKHLTKATTSKSESKKEKTSSKSENDKEKSAEECQCKCSCQNISNAATTITDSQNYTSLRHLPKAMASKSENDKEKTISMSENIKEKSADECQCKCTCQYPSYDLTTISDSQNYMSSEHLTKATTNKSESKKEKTSSKSENDTGQSAEECQCKFTCVEIKERDRSTVSDNLRWLITPEGIMRGLEALKQSFLGTEDHTSIWINNIVNRTPGYLNENQTSPHEDTSSEPNPSSETYHRKKSVSIQEPIRMNKCVYCGTSLGSCEEDGDGCVSPKRDGEVKEPEASDKGQGPESVFFVENVEQKLTRSGINWDPNEDEDGTREAAGSHQILRAKVVKKESVQDSGGSSCAGACEQYYCDKLLATLQILENKEETIRVQGSSLAVAEDRITELTKRASELRQELEHKARELNQIRQFADSREDKHDVSVSAEMKDADARKHLVETLEDNLTTVIELYRECFYETAKQEELIDMLRKSYLDVRLIEKDKTEKINRLQNVINTQKRSIEQCQDVVLEVESLKSEISSFLNSSNNDSGMWERGSESPDVGEELSDILEQLRQLQQMLTSDCTCGLEEECSSLKERNKALEVELEKQRQRNNELDGALRQILEQQYEKQMKEKERELQEVVKKLANAENTCKERGETCETLTRQLQQAQVMLDDKTAELVEAQQAREARDSSIRCLQQELDKSEQLVKEGLQKLSGVAHSRTELLLESQARISELEQRLRHSSRRCRDLEAGCREREASLEEAHARGARLCDESRRVTQEVKQWMREKKQLARQQQETIKMQKLRIRELEQCVGAIQNHSELTSQSETDPGCSNTQEFRSTCETSYPRCSRLNPSCRSETTTFPRGPMAGRIERDETASCSKCASNRQESASEMASCSQAPVPPLRKKRQSCDDLSYRATQQRFESSGPDIRWSRLYSRARQVSPADEVLARVERLHAALLAAQRRWGRPRRSPHVTSH